MKSRPAIPPPSTPTGGNTATLLPLAAVQDTETKDRPPPKQTYPFERRVLEWNPLPVSAISSDAYAMALDPRLGSHSNYVDFREPRETEREKEREKETRTGRERANSRHG